MGCEINIIKLLIGAKELVTKKRKFTWSRRPKILFIDFKSAFDKVNRRIMFRKLEAAGFPQDWINTLKYLYRETRVSYDGIQGTKLGSGVT